MKTELVEALIWGIITLSPFVMVFYAVILKLFSMFTNTTTVTVSCRAYNKSYNRCTEYDSSPVTIRINRIRSIKHSDRIRCYVEAGTEFGLHRIINTINDSIRCQLDGSSIIITLSNVSLLYREAQSYYGIRIRVVAEEGNREREIATVNIRFKVVLSQKQE